MDEKNVHYGHRERLRQKYIKIGAENFCEHELLEILLFAVQKRGDTNKIAHLLVDNFGSLSAVFEAEVKDLVKIKGVGVSSAEYIKFISDFIKFYKEEIKPIKLQTYKDMADFFINYFKDNPSENCVFIAINDASEVTGKYNFDFSQIISEQLKLKHIAEILIKDNVTNLIIGIKHKEDVKNPFITDFKVLKKLNTIFSQIEINIVDFIIYKNQSTFSMRKHGAFSF